MRQLILEQLQRMRDEPPDARLAAAKEHDLRDRNDEVDCSLYGQTCVEIPLHRSACQVSLVGTRNALHGMERTHGELLDVCIRGHVQPSRT